MKFHAIVDVVCIGHVSAIPFILCFFATHATHEVLYIGDVAYTDLSWYQLPPNLRKRVWMIMLRSQSPVYFTGFKLIRCTLEVYSSVSMIMQD